MQTRATIRGNVLVALLLLVSFPNFAFAREIGSFEDFSASVADSFQCADVIDVTVDIVVGPAGGNGIEHPVLLAPGYGGLVHDDTG